MTLVDQAIRQFCGTISHYGI